jgi:hypothetical protein
MFIKMTHILACMLFFSMAQASWFSRGKNKCRAVLSNLDTLSRQLDQLINEIQSHIIWQYEYFTTKHQPLVASLLEKKNKILEIEQSHGIQHRRQ